MDAVSSPAIPIRQRELVSRSENGKAIRRLIITDNGTGRFEVYIYFEAHTEPFALYTERGTLRQYRQLDPIFRWIQENMPALNRLELHTRPLLLESM